MPCGNGQTLSKRKHGVCVPRFSFCSFLFVALWCLEARGSGPPGPGARSCSPCPANCSCVPAAGPRQSCVVNCTSIGLERAPAAADIPLATSVLDLSKNHISSFDTSLLERISGLRELYLHGNRINVLPRGVFCCGPLSVIDLSNNQISTIEEGTCTRQCNLTHIDLSGNPFQCHCKLFRLVSWLRDKDVRLRRPEATLCDNPPELRHQPLLNVSLLTCGLNYVACLEDSSSGGGAGRSELVIFSSSKPGNFTREQCNSVCFAASHRYGGLGGRHECLCSTNSEPNLISESHCSAACTNPQVMEECCWTLAHDVFKVNFSIFLRPLPLQNVHSSVSFSAASSVAPVTMSWDFGDLSSRVNTSGSSVANTTHKYGLPGRYMVTLMGWAGNNKVSALKSEVTVTLPPKLELHCPILVVANQSLEVTLVSWGSVGVDVDWKITKEGVQVAKASPFCPKDGVPHEESSRCFHIVPGELSWTDARKQCSDRGGDLAVVRNDALRNLLAQKVTQGRGVWLGLSDVNSAGKLLWVNGSEAQEGEEGLAPRSPVARGNLCVSLDQHSQTSSHSCNAKRAYVCQYNPQVHVPDSGVFALGLAVFPTYHLLHATATRITTSPPPPPHGGVEVLLFPALSFIQAGRLSSLEFVSRELSSQTHVWFQIYRPHCPSRGPHRGLRRLLPSCGGPACSPMALCVSADSRSADPPSCPQLEQWCPFQRRCLPLTSHCQSSSCLNCSQGHQLPTGARRPLYSLQYEVLFSLSAGPAAHVLLQDELENLLVSNGDVIGLQHDAGPASLVRCQSSPHSLWRQPVFALGPSQWLWRGNAPASPHNSTREDSEPLLDTEAWVEEGRGHWLENVVCPVRVLYVGQSETRLQGPQLLAGLPQPGLYSLLVTSSEPSYPVAASCPLRVVPPLGLKVLHPSPQNGTLFLQSNNTRLLLRVQSRYETKAFCLVAGSRIPPSVTFRPDCPQEFASHLCLPGTSPGSVVEVPEPSMYAVLDLNLKMKEHTGPLQVELKALNNVTEDSRTVLVQLEEPLRGLLVQPHPAHRVLMESVVSYTASVLEGSNPTFKWTVDDKPFFTYYNTVLNVIYRHADVYKLTVMATNHVSMLTEDFNVTVDRLRPMKNLTVKGVPDVVPQGSTQTLTTSVLIDMSVPATVRWSFGDGGKRQFEYKPPYPPSLLCPESPHQVLLSNNVTYIYSQPGIYMAVFSVSNRYENLVQNITMSVYSILTRVHIQTEPSLLLAGKTADLEAHPLPSPYGIHYEWDFGDGSPKMQGRRVAHTFVESGPFNVCVSVDNTISSTANCTQMFAYEEIENLTAESSSPTELHSSTVVRAHLTSGNNITWTFSMGDGSSYTSPEPSVLHRYATDEKFTVNITARNAVSSGWTIIPVEVFVFQVVRIEPSGCVREHTLVNFRAWVSGNASAYFYQWSFGDGSPNATQHGKPTVSHTYHSNGTYLLSLTMTSGITKASQASFVTWVCVQPVVTNISVAVEKPHFSVGEKVQFQAKAEPESSYSYQWDFGGEEELVLVHDSGNVVNAYKNPGCYLVKVVAFNNISNISTSVAVEVLLPVGAVALRHNGTHHNNLTLGMPYLFSAISLASTVSYLWNFGQGTVLNGQNVLHAFNTAGSYNVTLTAANRVGRNHTSVPVTVLAPVSGLTINSSLVNVPLNTSVHFEAHMDEGDAVRFSWILCDRCTPILGTNTMFYTFRSVGAFNIIVTAENDVGTAQASVFLFVQRELEGLQIRVETAGGGIQGPDWVATNHLVRLHAEVKEGTNMTFTWNLIRELDPASSSFNVSGRTVEVNFSTPGPCDVLLQAANLLGQLSVNRTIFFLQPARKVQLHISANPVAVNALSNLTVVNAEGSNLQYRWLLDGVDLQWSQSWMSHTFTSAGLKLVTVEVFNQVSSQGASEIVSVQEIISGLKITSVNVTEQSYLATSGNVCLQGEISTGSNVTWSWWIDGRWETGKKACVIFPEPKTVAVTLNATNDVSGLLVSREFFVQERILSLELKASKKIAAVNEKVEFSISLVAGTDVRLILSISGDATVILQPNQTYVHTFSRVDTYMVNLTAHNEVSYKRRHLQVEVMEPVWGLSIQDAAAAIPVGEKRQFVASIQTGKPVHFLWTFDLRHLYQTTRMGKEVSYTAEEAGLLTIYLRALNTLHTQNITRQVQVQNVLTRAVLHLVPQDTFINKSVTMSVLVTPKNSSEECLWDFGDASAAFRTSNTTVAYKYSHPGHYRVQVNCSNMVSWVEARAEVNITVLECEEPEVQVVQAPRLAIWRSQPALVEASVNLKGCLRYGAQYLWQILWAQSCDGHPHLSGGASRSSSVVSLPAEVDVQRLQLSLPKMVLPAGNYTLVFSLSYANVPLKKAACLQLSVMAARLMPIIEGGTYRVWSRTQDLQLSAEQSYDPNMDPDNQSLLHYDWDCQSTSRGPEHCSTLTFGLGKKYSVLGISHSELEAGIEYTFKLSISKEGMQPESTSQTVLVQSGRIPMVYLECVSCKVQSLYEVSQNSYVYLKGTCSNCQGFHRGRWSATTLQNDTLVLDSSSTTTGSDGMNLVLRRGVLHLGESYIFTLHVTDDSLDGEGAASITLRHNMPPDGGECHLRRGGDAGQEYEDEEDDTWRIKTLLDRVQFSCSGYSDLGVSETPLLYSLLVTRCRDDFCEDFCVYRGSSSEHSAFLPPGFRSAQHRVNVSITVEDHQGAALMALNKTIEVVLPDPPPGYSSLPHWLSDLIDVKLKKLLDQGDFQRVRELSLALVTVLNEYEQTRESVRVSQVERAYRVRVRNNITRALTALDLTTVSDIQQTSAALAQCTAVSREFICEECQNSTLNKLESMLEILQTDTKQGTVTPKEIADNILNIMGDLIHQVSQSASQSYVDSPSPFLSEDESGLDPSPPSLEPHPLRVAAKAYSLSSVLMLILMHARVLNEEPLVLRGAEIAATGKLADPQSLLCYHGNNSPECQLFSIPRAFNNSLGKAAAGRSIMQLLFQVESNPFPFNYVANYTVSTEVASMEFRTENGTHIPISGLDDSLAITVAVNNGSAGAETGPKGAGTGGVPTAGVVNISFCGSVVVRVSMGNTNRQAGLFVQLNFTSQQDVVHQDGREEEEPSIAAYLHSHDKPNEFNCTDSKRITLSMTRGADRDHRKYTFFLSPESYDTTLDYFINVSTACGAHSRPAGVRLEVGVFASLCQYFSESEKQWRTDGMVPLAETNASRAVCRTRHLTAFGAGMFVPDNVISIIVPERPEAPSLVVLLVCVLGLMSYVVAAAILHKLDQMDLRRAAVVPLCGCDGLFKYEIQVKTGWSRGAGTTAHVGISLYGRQSRSGHRHLDSRGSFARNALDIFHIATDTSLGNIWKIRIWHDNKGLSPAWMLHYVLVKDLQTGSSYYFLVEEWLSVDNEKTDGRVEMEVEASEEAALLLLPRLLRYELQRALCETHLWLSLFERPPRSPFTRLQRATCCTLLLQLLVLANTWWYSIVVDTRSSPQPVSRFASLSGETVAAGVLTCLLVYPLYLLVYTLFRMSRSKCVSVEQVPPQVDQESVEIDDFLDNSMGGTSFLFYNGETDSEETNVDVPSPSTRSVESWDMTEGELEVRDWPELLGEAPAMGGTGCPPGLPRLKRAQGSRHLGVDLAFNADTEHGGDGRNKHFTSSDEDLIKRILTDGHPLFPQADGSDMADLSSIFEDHTEVILLQKLNEPLPLESVRRDPPKTAFTSNTVVTDVCRPRRFPPVCGRAALWGSWTGIAVASGASMWASHGFTQNVAMLWLISCFAGFLCSCLLLEPIKVVCEALYYAAYVRRLRPEDQDVLVEFPRVERVVQRVSRVRPPQGFALSQARQQARKVHMLHTMLKNFLVYMFFLLVVLLLNYADSGKHTHSLRLRNQLQRGLRTPDYHSVSSRGSVLMWLNQSLLPRLLDDSVLLRDTGSVFLGTLRLRQTRDEQNDVVSAAGGNSWITSSTGTTGNASVSGSPSTELLPQGSAQETVRDSSEVEVQLNRSLAEACSTLQRWINNRSRSVLVEFSLYNINTNLLAVFSFLMEFPVSDRALPSMELHVITLWPFRGLDLQLLLTVVLLALVFYFLVPGIAGFLREGFAYLLCVWRVLGICKLALAACVCGLHLSRCAAATQLWTLCLKHLHHDFTDFYPLARRTRLYTLSGALLLFVLVLKVSHQLRFLREWAVFGRALQRSSRELLAAAVALLLLLLAYAHAGHLLLHSVADGYSSVASAGLSLVGAGGRALLSWRPCWTTLGPSNPSSSLVFHTSFALLRLVFLWLVISVLLRNYQRARAELYCPAVDLQDYEMVELFLRRLKMWMGLSRAKEFRHKVRFEGMELPPSRSSSTSDCKSLCLPPLDAPESPPTPDSIDAGSEASWRPASSSPCSFTEAPGVSLGLSLGLHISPGVVVGDTSWRERAETEASLKRLLPTLDALLQQLDRVTMATEDVYHVECRLERAQSKRGRAATEKGGAAGVSSGERGEDPGRWRERKRGKEKQSVSKMGQKVEKSERCKDGRASASLKTAPAAAAGGSSKPLLECPLPQAHTPAVPPSTPAPTPPPPLTPITLNWDPPTERDTLPSSSLFNHPAHTTIIPTRKRKRKTPPLKNKVHPNLDKHGPGPPKP